MPGKHEETLGEMGREVGGGWLGCLVLGLGGLPGRRDGAGDY